MGLDAERAIMKNPTLRYGWLPLAFLIGFLLCWTSLGIFFGISGHRASLLAFALLRLEEFLRTTLNRGVGSVVIAFPPPRFALTIVISALFGGLPFVAAITLAQSGRLALRWTGYALICILAFSTLYWPLIPRDLF
jgi:hypothetical protein